MTAAILTPPQAFTIGLVSQDPHSGPFIRGRLSEQNLLDSESPMPFYNFMQQLEDSGLIESWYESQVMDGNEIKTKNYATTVEGVRAMKRSLKFYQRVCK